MTSPELSAIKERGAQYQFHIELLDRSGLYRALNRQIDNAGSKPTLEIGSLHAKSGLFSQISILANIVPDAYLLRGGYSIMARLKYRKPANQYRSKEQSEHLRELIKSVYQDADVERKTSKSSHSLVIVGPISKLLYVIDLGYENEKTAYNNQVERDSNTLLDEESLRRFMTARYPTSIDSHIAVRPMDADLNAYYPQDFFSIPIVSRFTNETQAVKDFTETTKQWMWRIQDIVNAMSKVKGIPQSGTLALVPQQG